MIALAWWGAGALTRRAQGAMLPPLADLSGLPAPAREQVEAADAAARSHPREADALGALGMAYHASLLPGPAMDTYALAEQLDPAGWRWTYYRGLLLEERGRQSEALDAFTRVTTVDPAQGMAWFRIGEIAFKDGRLDDAERAYGLAAQAPAASPFVATVVASRQVTPLAAYAQLGQARVAIDRGQRTQAIATLDGVISRYPAFGPARTMRVQLDAEAPARDAETAGRARLHAALRSAAGRRGRTVAHARPAAEARRARGTRGRRRVARVPGAPGAAVQPSRSECPDGDGGRCCRRRAGSARRWTTCGSTSRWSPAITTRWSRRVAC